MKKYFLAIILIFIVAISNVAFATDYIKYVNVNEKTMRAYVKG